MTRLIPEQPITVAITQADGGEKEGSHEAPRRPLNHGRRGTYTKYKCRCADCRQANTDYLRDYYARNFAGAVDNLDLPRGPHL